jgi:hypothetical protein
MKMYNLFNEIFKNTRYITRKNLLNWNTISNASELIGKHIEPILVITPNGSTRIPGSIKKMASSIYLILCIKVQLILNTINTSINIIKKNITHIPNNVNINTPTKIVPLQEIPKNITKKTQKVKETKNHTKQSIVISVENLPQITFDKNITDMNQKYHSSNTEGNIIQMIHNLYYVSLDQNKYLRYITKIHITKGIHPTKSIDHFTADVTGKSQKFIKRCHFNINNKMITEITYKRHKKTHIVKCIK